jgi:hypothetical protein
VCPRPGLIKQRGEKLCPYRDSDSELSAVQPVANCYSHKRIYSYITIYERLSMFNIYASSTNALQLVILSVEMQVYIMYR